MRCVKLTERSKLLCHDIQLILDHLNNPTVSVDVCKSIKVGFEDYSKGKQIHVRVDLYKASLF